MNGYHAAAIVLAAWFVVWFTVLFLLAKRDRKDQP